MHGTSILAFVHLVKEQNRYGRLTLEVFVVNNITVCCLYLVTKVFDVRAFVRSLHGNLGERRGA